MDTIKVDKTLWIVRKNLPPCKDFDLGGHKAIARFNEIFDALLVLNEEELLQLIKKIAALDLITAISGLHAISWASNVNSGDKTAGRALLHNLGAGITDEFMRFVTAEVPVQIWQNVGSAYISLVLAEAEHGRVVHRKTPRADEIRQASNGVAEECDRLGYSFMFPNRGQ